MDAVPPQACFEARDLREFAGWKVGEVVDGGRISAFTFCQFRAWVLVDVNGQPELRLVEQLKRSRSTATSSAN